MGNDNSNVQNSVFRPVGYLEADVGRAGANDRTFKPEMADVLEPIDYGSRWTNAFSAGLGAQRGPWQLTGVVSRSVEQMRVTTDLHYGPPSLSTEDISMALKTWSFGLEAGRFVGPGLFFSAQPYVGWETSCNSTGAIGSCYTDRGSIIISEAGDFVFGGAEDSGMSYLEVPRVVGGLKGRAAWDFFSPKNNQAGIQLFVQGSWQFVNATLPGAEDNGGTHKIEHTETGRRHSADLQVDGALVSAGIGLRVYGDPLKLFKKGSFLGLVTEKPDTTGDERSKDPTGSPI